MEGRKKKEKGKERNIEQNRWRMGTENHTANETEKTRWNSIFGFNWKRVGGRCERKNEKKRES